MKLNLIVKTHSLLIGLIYSVTFLAVSSLQSQVTYKPLNHQLNSFNAYARNTDESSVFKVSSIRPDLSSYSTVSDKLSYRNYIPNDSYDSSIFANRKYKEYSWFRRKLLVENFIIIDTGQLYITIDPLLNISRGQSSLNQNEPDQSVEEDIYNNTRGLLIRADIGKKFSMETYLYENQSAFPNYIKDFVTTTGVVPGQGRVKDFKEGDFDYAYSGGYFSYAPWETVTVQFGHHKHFIGDGYRSLILSDNSFNYPFLRFNLNNKNNKLRYSILYASYQDLDRVDSTGPSEGIFRKKGASYHVLEYQFTKRLRVNLIQGVIWPIEAYDGTSSFDPAMFNPIILVQPAISGMDNKNNAILGLGFDFNPINRLEMYGQAVVDDEELKQTAFQLGLKIYPLSNTFIQIEGNWVSSYIYGSNTSEYFNAHVHYNQATANPLGNNFDEIVFRASHRYKRLIPFLQINYSHQRNLVQKVLWTKFELAYLLNPATNLKVFAHIVHRSSSATENDFTSVNRFINFGIKTDLRNIYYDF